MDNTDHNLIHTLNVRIDALWHHNKYQEEAYCDSCRSMYDRLRELDEDALAVLKDELIEHVHNERISGSDREHAEMASTRGNGGARERGASMPPAGEQRGGAGPS